MPGRSEESLEKDTLTTSFCLLFGIYFSVESYRLGLGKLQMPGPGYFPFGASVLFAICSAVAFVTSMRRKSGDVRAGSPEPLHWWNIVFVLGGMLGYILALDWLGFLLCTFMLLILVIRFVARQGWVFSLTVSLIMALGSHILFDLLLNAQLPTGLLKF